MRRVDLSWPIVAVTAACSLLLGVGGAYLWLPRSGAMVPASPGVGPAAPSTETASGPLPDVAIDLSDDAITKAGVVVSSVTLSQTTGNIRLSGVVEPDAYRQAVVTPLLSGRVTRVAVTLGERVARNAALVEIYS